MGAKIFWHLSLSVGIMFLASAARAQDAKLVEAAKKEGGKVVVYGSIENDTMDLIAAALKKKSGLDTEYWRASATKVMDRVTSESRAGKPLFDVALTTDATMQLLQKDGFLARYDSPSARSFPREAMRALDPATATVSSELFIMPESLNRRTRQNRLRIC